jgi:hypothetical protein
MAIRQSAGEMGGRSGMVAQINSRIQMMMQPREKKLDVAKG